MTGFFAAASSHPDVDDTISILELERQSELPPGPLEMWLAEIWPWSHDPEGPLALATYTLCSDHVVALGTTGLIAAIYETVDPSLGLQPNKGRVQFFRYTLPGRAIVLAMEDGKLQFFPSQKVVGAVSEWLGVMQDLWRDRYAEANDPRFPPLH